MTTSSSSIRLIDAVIRVAGVVLTILTALALVLLVVTLLGHGSMSVDAVLDEPYAVEFSDGRRVSIDQGIRSYENFEIGRERDELAEIGSVAVTVNVGRSDRDSRAVIAAVVLAFVGAAWVGLLSLAAVVATIRENRPFVDENPRRLRRVGAALIAVPAIAVTGRMLLRATLDTDLPVSLDIASSVPWVAALAGFGFLALGAVFAEAARLREFEESTI